MKYTIIPSGYRISITTWENDGDNYNTKVVYGLNKDFASFIVEFCRLFEHSHNVNDNYFGNIYEPNDYERKTLYKAIQTIIDKYESFPEDYCNNPEGVLEYAYDLGITSDEFFTRVVKDIKVEFIADEIKIEDHTDEFVN